MMTDLNELERRLWAAAEELRANSSLTPAEYRRPVLGLIFLAFAEHRFDDLRPELELKATERALALRIGVNTGDVVVGRPRELSSFVSGDAVNVAARLEQAAEPGETLAGERTVGAARGAFEFDELCTVAAKGKPDGVPCRRVVRALSLMRPRGVSGLARAFIERDDEVRRLCEAYHAAVKTSRAPVTRRTVSA
jgi:HsdM N-terminal domain/Adenylate and Guanylate cyclase catalytic domain